MFEVIGLFLLIVGIILWIPYITKTSKDGAPFVPMEPEVAERLMNLAEVKKGDVFYGFGSGDGRLVISAALRKAKAYGVKIDRLRVWYFRFWIFLLRLKNAQIIFRDIFKTDLSKADVVSIYLFEETNNRLRDKFKEELKSGVRVVATGFIVPGWKPAKIDPMGTI